MSQGKIVDLNGGLYMQGQPPPTEGPLSVHSRSGELSGGPGIEGLALLTPTAPGDEHRFSLQELFTNARVAAGAAPALSHGLRSGSDALEHLVFHDEGARIAQQDPEGGRQGQRPAYPPAADQPAAVCRRVQG